MNKQILINEKFLPIFSNTEKRYVVCVNGAGTAKSYTYSAYLVLKCLEKAKTNVLVVRKSYASIESSIFKDIKNFIYDYELDNQTTTINKRPLLVEFKNGSSIIFKGADDVSKLKSISSISIIMLEEASELEYTDFAQLDMRMRSKAFCHMLIASNPTSPDSWLKEIFFDGKGKYKEKTLLLENITYKDNMFLSQEFIQQLEDLIHTDQNLYDIYVKGIWGRVNRGNPFWKMFSNSNIIDSYDINDLNLLLSFDFNSSPYCTCVIAQYSSDKDEIVIVKTILSESPNNTTAGLCQKVIDYISKNNLKNNLKITGDYSGHHKDSRSEINDFDIIRDKFKNYNTTFILRTNESVVATKNFINNKFSNLELFVLDTEKEFIKEMFDTQEDIDGTILKTKARDKNTGAVWEKAGHISDALRYLVVNFFYDQYLKFNNKNSGFRLLRTGK